MDRSLVQILVVVANIQIKSLKTEVGKGSMATVVVHRLIDPKELANASQNSKIKDFNLSSIFNLNILLSKMYAWFSRWIW